VILNVTAGSITIVPKKRFGQHFLTDPGIFNRIVEFSRVGPDDRVVEIGPGRGGLTAKLAAKAQHVTAIEVDSDLIGHLQRSAPSNVNIVGQDALTIDFNSIVDSPYVLVANLPYNIATPLIERFIAARASIGSLTVMVQKEVAERILAAPGGRDYGALSVGVQYYAKVEAGFVLGPEAFSPPPRVDSQMIRMEWKPDVRTRPDFIRFVRTAFASRRKKLTNNLGSRFPGMSREVLIEAIEGAGLDANVRPEGVSVDQFFRLYTALGGSA